MSMEILRVIKPGASAAIQDAGRVGWKRFGVPSSGAMDDHAARWANRLLDNPPEAPLLEVLLAGAEFAVQRDVWITITGAHGGSSRACWRVLRVCSGETIRFAGGQNGVWSYVAVEGGFEAPRFLGSASVYARGGLGMPLQSGDVLRRTNQSEFHLPEHVAGRIAPWNEQRDYRTPPALRVWPGPQWGFFSDTEKQKFFAQNWTVSSQSDRVGYRLKGEPLASRGEQIISEPVRVGSIQIPENGQPIVTLRDGPTVGGYPKLGLVDAADIAWLVQCNAGQPVRFRLAA